MSLALEIKKPLEAITNPEDIPHFASVVASAFSNDVVNRYLYLGRDSRPDHPKLQPDLRAKYWERVITPRFQDRALLIQSHDWAAVALWLPPGVEKPPPNPAIVSEGGLEYRDFFDALRKEKLGSRLHWHLNLIARNPVRDDGGAISAIFEPVLSDAKAKNLPIWLESTNVHAKEVYEHFGFKVIGDVRIGKGLVGSDGWAKDDGEGVLVWGMIAGLDGW